MMIGRRPSRSESQPATSGIGTESTINPAYIRFVVAAGVVARDGGPARSGGALLRSRPFADGVGGGTADPRDDVGRPEGQERLRRRLEREARPEEEATDGEDRPPGDAPGHEAVRRLDQAGAHRAHRRQEGDRLDADMELRDDEQEDRRQDDRLGVVDRVRDGQQPEGPPGVDPRGRTQTGAAQPGFGVATWRRQVLKYPSPSRIARMS